MKTLRLVSVISLLALMVAVVGALPSTTEAGGTPGWRLRTAVLTGAPGFETVSGKAVYGFKPAERKLGAEISGAFTLIGQTLDVYRNGVKVGTMTVDSFGRGDLSINSLTGVRVPVVRKGALIQVKAGATLVASGMVR